MQDSLAVHCRRDTEIHPQETVFRLLAKFLRKRHEVCEAACFDQVSQRLDRLALAPPVPPDCPIRQQVILVEPELEKATADVGDAGVAIVAPLVHGLAKFVHQEHRAGTAALTDGVVTGPHLLQISVRFGVRGAPRHFRQRTVVGDYSRGHGRSSPPRLPPG